VKAADPTAQASVDPLRHHRGHASLRGAFGQDSFGRHAEAAARFFGTPQYIIGQTVIVALWVVLNSVAVIQHWDPYPFILLNLAFSTQAAYAAPLILLAETRQADRDRANAIADAKHREELAEHHNELIEANTRLTEQVDRLTREIHSRLVARDPAPGA
jgi:uncharacterized membrane protein